MAQIPASLWISLLLVLGIIAVYWPVFHYGFVQYDNQKYILKNQQVLMGLTWPGIVWAFTTFYAGNWHPLTWLSYMLETQLFGMHAGVYHATNVLFHAANAVLLFWLLKRMMGPRPESLQQPRNSTPSDAENAGEVAVTTAAPQAGTLWRCAFVAALFGFHPLHVESVAWIAERKDVLSTFFFLLTLLAYTQYVQASIVQRPGSKVFYGLALLWFALGLMSKPMLVTLPFVLLLLDYWPLQRIRNSEFGVPNFIGLLLEKLPFFALTAASCAVTFLAQKHGGAVVSTTVIPLGDRIQNALVSYWVYVEKMLWPNPLVVFYPYSPVQSGAVAAAVFMLLVISVGVFLSPRRRPYLVVGWLWYLGTLVPVIGLVQVGAQALADRYTYIPLIGLFIAITWGVADLLSGWRYRQGVLTAAAVAVLGTCLTLTAAQVGYWRNSETLARHALAVTADNDPMEVLLGNGLVENGKIKEATQHFADALRLSPDDISALGDLAVALASQGRLAEAADHCRTALKVRPREPKVHYILANILSEQGKLSEAIAEYRTTLRLDPDHTLALNDLAWILATTPDARLRDGAEAVKLATKACQLTNYRMTLFVGTLAAAYAEAGRFDDAVKTANQAIALATAGGQPALAGKNRELLQLYQAHKAYHQPSSH